MKIIALTDDDPLILKTIKSLLNDKYKVVCLNSGKALLQYLKEGNRPDLILLDYLMPICDGPTTLELIREDKELKDIPAVFLTGVAEREKVEECLAMKPQGYLKKPVSPVLLWETVERILGE